MIASYRRKLIVKLRIFLYTSMMNKYQTTLTILGMLAVLAPHAHAYITPEQQMRQSEYDGYVPAYDDYYESSEEEDHEAAPEPSGIRYSKPTPTFRVQESKGPPMRLNKNTIVEEEEVLIDESIGEEEEPEEGSSNVTLQLDAKTLRLLERLTNPKSSANVLSPSAHSGAPLAPTGPATVIAMGAMGIAMYATMKRARRFEK